MLTLKNSFLKFLSVSVFCSISLYGLCQAPELLVQTGLGSASTALATSADKRYLAVAGTDLRIKLFDLKLGKEIASVSTGDIITGLAFSSPLTLRMISYHGY